MVVDSGLRGRALATALLIGVAQTTVFAVQGTIPMINDQQRLQTVALAYPGARLNPNGTIVVPQKNGSLQPALLNGLSRRPVANGFLYIAGVGIAQEKKGTADVPTHDKVVVFYTDRQGSVTSSKVQDLDAKALSSAIVDFYWETVPKDGSFPVIRVMYSASYQTSEFVGVIRWAAKLDTATMELQERVPAAFTKTSKDGTVKEDYLTATRVDAAHIEIVSALSGTTVRYACGSVCVVDPFVLLKSL